MADDGFPRVQDEFRDVELGDTRLSKRLAMVASAGERAPGASLPERAGSEAALEATYRFFGNERVSAESVLDGHIRSTLRRSEVEDCVLVVHDTTEFRFGGHKEREGLGRLSTEKRDGFLAHYSICVAPEGKPLGTVGLYAWARDDKKREVKVSHNVVLRSGDRESLRWQEAALQAAERLSDVSAFIHVMDREGDSFELFSFLVEHDQRFIIRLGHDRRRETGRGKCQLPRLFDVLSSAPVYFEREVVLSRRARPSKSRGKGYPARESRSARLEVRADRQQIFAAHTSLAHVPTSLTLQFVEAREIGAPEGEEPVVWRLITTEPIDTEEQIAAIIDAYRRRWIIEEFFKALKTGCRYQDLQLESGRALMVALAVESAIAWRLLLMRWLVNQDSHGPASAVLRPAQLSVLHKLSSTDERETINVTEALTLIARLGGHLRNNGPPGWLTLRRGFEKLSAIEQGWMLSQGEGLEM